MVKFKPYRVGYDYVHLLIVLLITFIIYAWSMPRTVVFEDDGFFVIAAYFNSVTHPPGYPLFVMLSHIFTWLPVGNVAYRVHMASALFGAFSCVCLWYIVRLLLEKKIYAYFAALGFGISKTFWSQAIVAEVYTLNVLLFLILFILALHCSARDRKNHITYFKWLAFIYGLALSNHWPLILLSTPVFMVILWPQRKLLFSNILKLIPFLLLGLLPYVWMVWRSHVIPELSFYGPIQSLQDFWFFVSREPYSNVDYSITAGWYDKILFAGFVLKQSAIQLGPIGILFICAGFIWQWTRSRDRLAYSMLAGFAGSTLLLILILDFDYDLFHQTIFMVYPLISYVMLAIWAVMGLRLIDEKFIETNNYIKNKNLILTALVFLTVISSFIVNLPHNYRKNDYMAEEYAKTLLNLLEDDAIFYANTDNIDGPVRYLNEVEGVRTDVTVFNGRYISFNNNMYRPYQLKAAELKNIINQFIQTTDRPIYYANDFPNDYRKESYGLYEKVSRGQTNDTIDSVKIYPTLFNMVIGWPQQYRLENMWEKMHYNLVRADLCKLLLNVKYFNMEPNKDSIDNNIEFICMNYQGILNRLMFEVADPDKTESELERLFVLAKLYQSQAYSKEEQARLGYYQGLFELRVGNNQQARVNFHSSIDIWPHPDNPSRNMLDTL